MPGREHEAVAVDPVRVGRIVLHDARVERVGDRGSAIGVPGCPEFAFSTASIDSVRMVSTDSFSRLCWSVATDMWLLFRVGAMQATSSARNTARGTGGRRAVYHL